METQTSERVYAILASQIGLIGNIAQVQGETTEGRIKICEEEFMLPVLLFRCSMLEDVFGKDTYKPGAECRIGDTMYPFLALQEGSADLELLCVEEEQPKSWQGLIDVCQLFSTYLGGIKILLHGRTPSHFHESFPDKENVFHIFVHTVPTGDQIKQHYPNLLFGINVETPAGFYAVLEHTRGRGVALGDERSKVVQIIGNNIYLLFDPFKIMEAGYDVGMKVFKKTLALAFEHIRMRKQQNSTETEVECTDTTAESVEELADAYATHGLSAFERDIATIQNKVREAEDRLVELQRELRELQNFRKLIVREDFYAGKLRTRLCEEHTKIMAHPMVKRAYIIPETCYEVETHTVHITHKGVERTIGSYVLRFTSNGVFSIYTKISYHPKHVPHPHICAWNGPCLGNVKRAIAESCAEYRFADACMYIIDWLTTGYTPELVVHHKVEEWPITTQHKEEA